MSVLNIFTLFLRFASLLLSFPKCFLSHLAKCRIYFNYFYTFLLYNLRR